MRPNFPLEADESLRLRLWNQFRSSSRDHAIPMTGAGRTLQRVVINRVLGAAGVSEGAALSVEERAQDATAERAVAERSRVPENVEPGETRYMAFRMRTTAIIPAGPPANFISQVVAVAPFDGFISELSFDCPNLGNPPGIFAVRSSSGATMFQGNETQPVPVGDFDLAPDFGFVATFANDAQNLTLRNLHMPVFAGDEITVVFQTQFGLAAGFNVLAGIFGFTQSRLGRPGRVVQSSSISARAEQLDMATREPLPKPAPKVPALVRPIAAGGPVSGSIFAPAESAAPAGGGPEGKTYVQAWTPTAGALGYLIPKPPAGGKVNVFNGRYTIWSGSGQNLGEGPVEWVRNESEIPGNTAVSRSLGMTPSAALPISVAQGGEIVPARVVLTGWGGTRVVPYSTQKLFG